ncbi:SDR family oxidoreductase [Gallaecimonas mangrovi]|uniref:SDR family oxidoreductase n=1 Tax=Gallaecimonas mangrovi TaxID=2291597 RepID=UPI000E2023DA|nr:SDR family oxidoreductase [Gallaecimonas mangrovi]
MSHPVAIVTGASKGIGAAIAEHLANAGFAVAVNYSSSPAAAQDVVQRITASGGKAVAIQADVADHGAVTRLFDQAEQALGKVTAVVCNAGIMTLAPVEKYAQDAFSTLMAINLNGVFNTLQLAAQRLGKGGRIVTLSTSVVGTNFPGYGPYAASKAAVETLSKVLSKELEHCEISVNVVAPGPTATELFMEGKSDEVIARIAAMNPYKRLGKPQDIADVIGYLLSEGAAWVNGQVIRVNGGMV